MGDILIISAILLGLVFLGGFLMLTCDTWEEVVGMIFLIVLMVLFSICVTFWMATILY